MVVVEVGDGQYPLRQLLFERVQIWLLPWIGLLTWVPSLSLSFFTYTVETKLRVSYFCWKD